MELVENRPYQTQSFRKPCLQIILVDFRMKISSSAFSQYLYYGKEKQVQSLGGHLGKGPYNLASDMETLQLTNYIPTIPFVRLLIRAMKFSATSVKPSAEYGRVWHKGLLFKLRTIGCSDRGINWFRSYLSNRRQRVVINGQASDWASVPAGVPQGSIFGPLLFLFFNN